MARTVITVNDIPNQGSLNPIVETAGDSTNDHTLDNSSGKVTLHMFNGHSSAVQLSVISVPSENNRTGNIVASVAAGKRASFGPFKRSLWNQAGGNLINIDLDIDTLTILWAELHLGDGD